MHRLVVALAALLAAVVGTAAPAVADTGGSAVTDRGGVHSGVHTASGQPGGAASGGRAACTYTPVLISESVAVYDEDTGQRIQTDGTGQWYEKWCDGAFSGSVYIGRRDPADLLEEAWRYLSLPVPEPRFSPTGEQVVNLPTWMWLAGGWGTETSSVSVPGVTVTVIAVPESAIWSMGDGSTVVCDGPGDAYDPAVAATSHAPSCSHTYARSSAGQPFESLAVSVTVRWHATWSAAGVAGGGDLGAIDRTTTFALRVGEVQALNNRAN